MKDTIVGFIGLGVMGEPMCRNLRARSANRVLAFDIKPGPLQRLEPVGVESAASAHEVIRKSAVVFASLPSGKELYELAHGKDGLLDTIRAGQVFVDLGTSPVGLTRELAAALARKGAAYLDAPVARTRQAAESGTLAVMVGGDAEALRQVRPLIECFASDITHCGTVGSGQVTKILNNMVLFETVAALSEAHAIARRTGVDPAVLFEAFSKGSADSFALRNHGMKAILPQQFPLRAFSVEYAKKDLAYALEMAEDAGIDASGARNVARLFAQAIAGDFGEQYFPVISRILDPGA
jgi:3-hydroxyisobutyrate dehydrogenase-like beta-hydroxyacid dehydrogenase